MEGGVALRPLPSRDRWPTLERPTCQGGCAHPYGGFRGAGLPPDPVPAMTGSMMATSSPLLVADPGPTAVWTPRLSSCSVARSLVLTATSPNCRIRGAAHEPDAYAVARLKPFDWPQSPCHAV